MRNKSNTSFSTHGLQLERTALLIDFARLKQEGKTDSDVMEFMEDLEDILAVELSKSENDYSSWEDAKGRLKSKGIID